MQDGPNLTRRGHRGDDMPTALTPQVPDTSGNARDADGRSPASGRARAGAIAAAVQAQLEDLSSRWPQLILLPIAPLRGVEDLIRLELAVRREQRPEGLLEDERLADAMRVILGMARARWRTDASCQLLPQTVA
jgi:hypothetical protein